MAVKYEKTGGRFRLGQMEVVDALGGTAYVLCRGEQIVGLLKATGIDGQEKAGEIVDMLNSASMVGKLDCSMLRWLSPRGRDRIELIPSPGAPIDRCEVEAAMFALVNHVNVEFMFNGRAHSVKYQLVLSAIRHEEPCRE